MFIIPYFGALPDYFDLWMRSAECNPQYSFYLYTDADIAVPADSNVKVFPATFEKFRKRIYEKLGSDIKCNSPYKLCDYKPAYGLILEDEIREFPFWGFCDIDLILGKLDHFITDEMLESYDKLYLHGHFCLLRNNEKMRTLFMKKFDRVLDYRYAFSTDYICHFDENGTIAYAQQYDSTIKAYFDWDFADPSCQQYELKWGGETCFALWKNGILSLQHSESEHQREILYIHLQKRKMERFPDVGHDAFCIFRNGFYPYSEGKDLKIPEKSAAEEEAFLSDCRKAEKRRTRQNIRTGAVRFRVNTWIHRWKMSLGADGTKNEKNPLSDP